MTPGSRWPVADLLPHGDGAILIDAVTSCEADTLTASATVRPGGLYSLPDGSLPAYAGLELMAQAIAAWAGWQARQADKPVELGFLLGTRRYTCSVAAFEPGLPLVVTATRSLQDDLGMGVFECTLHGHGRLLAEARLNVYQPRDAGAFMQESPPSSAPSDSDAP